MSGEGGGEDGDDDDILGISGDAAEDAEKEFIQNLKKKLAHDDFIKTSLPPLDFGVSEICI